MGVSVASGFRSLHLLLFRGLFPTDGDIALDEYIFNAIFERMWEVEYTDEFGQGWDSLDEDEQESVAASVELLRQLGPHLPRPHADTLAGSRHAKMKELRTQHRGRAIRTLFAFD